MIAGGEISIEIKPMLAKFTDVYMRLSASMH